MHAVNVAVVLQPPARTDIGGRIRPDLVWNFAGKLRKFPLAEHQLEVGHAIEHDSGSNQPDNYKAGKRRAATVVIPESQIPSGTQIAATATIC